MSLPNKLIILNKLKSLSLGIDDLFKRTGMGSIKYHHAVSAVYQAVYSLVDANNINALRDIFGDIADDKETMKLMRTVLSEFVAGFIAAGTDDQELNKVYNNFTILDNEGRFPLRYEPIPSSSSFRGHLVVTDSFNIIAPLEVGKLVNVTLTINQDDAKQLVEVVRQQLEAIGLVVGRLTGAQDTTERHVSLALRIPYTNDMAAVVEKINKEMENITLSTATKLKIVIPTDIRTSESAVELLNDSSCAVLQKWQIMIHESVGKVGNKLPPLHITHGNSPVKSALVSDIMKLSACAPKFDTVLGIYGFNLSAALAANTSLSGMFAVSKSIFGENMTDDSIAKKDSALSMANK